MKSWDLLCTFPSNSRVKETLSVKVTYRMTEKVQLSCGLKKSMESIGYRTLIGNSVGGEATRGEGERTQATSYLAYRAKDALRKYVPVLHVQ